MKLCRATAILLLASNSALAGTAANNDENEGKNKKPLLLLHVGPPKTSTTTLQYFLSEYRSSLQEENWLFVGRHYTEDGAWMGYFDKPFSNLVDFECQVHAWDSDLEEDEGLISVYHDYLGEDHNSTSEITGDNRKDWTHSVDAPSCWKSFLAELNRVRRSGMNVLISDEMICIRGHNQEEFHFDMLYDTLTPDWNVQVLATYRRFHAWLPSEKNQFDQYRLSDWAEMDRFLEWGGEAVPPMYDYIKAAVEDSQNVKYPYLDDIMTEYGKYFGTVQTLNMHDLSEYKTLVSQLICRFVPNATKTCELSKTDLKATSSKILNAAKSGYYDMLAMVAYEEGMINDQEDPRLTRTYVRDAIEKQHEEVLKKKPSDFPLQCPTLEEMQPLLTKSLAYEEQLFPEYHAANKDIHTQEFMTMVEKKKYCSIDTAATLEQDQWRAFLEQLVYEEDDDDDEDDEESGIPPPVNMAIHDMVSEEL
eukprot:CAMPEP_0198146726 /NCGR_PEP_ID=MMETSP1443-20131203/31129_1 /TAXON_ID=186043 /ORGANISM="Entomoneis sp., Strain CCMP2396" /LENGTH=475 /DNA_ID=CAMNT_0043810787 /DNA_START=104 /DNA_END=1531 /DNA_ORIENTATION=+